LINKIGVASTIDIRNNESNENINSKDTRVGRGEEVVMEFTITRNNLLKGLTAVSRLASARMPLPILNNILIKAEPSSLVLSVTDLELGIQVTLPAKVDKPGTFTVPARLFHEFIQNSNEETFEGVVKDGATLSLTSERVGAKIRGLDASEFPGLPFVKSQPTFHLNAPQFKEGIDRVVFATAIDDTRPVLAGIYLKGEDQEVILAATDSHRLAEKRLKTTTKISQPCSVVVPKRTLTELSRLLSDETGDISVFVGDNQIQFAFGFTQVVSRLVEGNYPPYQAIIPKEYRTRVTAHLADFTTSVKTAQLFAKEAGNLIKLIIQPGRGMIVESVADQKGEAVSQFTAIAEGEELTMAFNVKYILDALSAIQAENVFLEFTDADRPVLVRPANTKEYFSLVMPLKLD
jgi:DNA polymerase III subunit beta